MKKPRWEAEFTAIPTGQLLCSKSVHSTVIILFITIKDDDFLFLQIKNQVQ